jgi:CHAT domain-containing protein
MLWDPVAATLGAAKRVLVVPDGAMLGVSFAALPLDDGAFLVERAAPMHLLDDERNLAQAPVRGGQGLLAVGGPDFDLGLATPDAAVAMLRGGPCGALGRAHFAALPETTREAQAVATLWRDATRDEATVLTAAAATEAAFKRAARGKRLLHLATHGIATDTCGAGLAATRAIALSKADAPVGSALSVYGLALAGANARASAHDADDGVLTAEELATLDLAGTEWAVLSSCDSGRGAMVDGEGLLGLRRALRLAGVGTSVISLWPIDDASTREWMEALYRTRFAGRASTADAVWQAHRHVLAARRGRGAPVAPFYWAPFVASGDWR